MLHVLAQEKKMAALQNRTTGTSSGPLITAEPGRTAPQPPRPSRGWADHDLGENHSFSPAFCLWQPNPWLCELSAIFRFLSQLKVHRTIWLCAHSFHSHSTCFRCAFCNNKPPFCKLSSPFKDQEEKYCREKHHKTIVKYLCDEQHQSFNYTQTV